VSNGQEWEQQNIGLCINYDKLVENIGNCSGGEVYMMKWRVEDAKIRMNCSGSRKRIVFT